MPVFKEEEGIRLEEIDLPIQESRVVSQGDPLIFFHGSDGATASTDPGGVLQWPGTFKVTGFKIVVSLPGAAIDDLKKGLREVAAVFTIGSRPCFYLQLMLFDGVDTQDPFRMVFETQIDRTLYITPNTPFRLLLSKSPVGSSIHVAIVGMRYRYPQQGSDHAL